MALRDSAPHHDGWGANRVVDIVGIKVFTKSLLVTTAEQPDPFGTQNIHRLPSYYGYGMGSAGFRAGRELALHHKTTRWVVEGACTHFPLTYHHRLLPAGTRTPKVPPHALDDYVRSWNHNPAIRRLVDARNAATIELFVVLEFIPHVLRGWFFDHPEAAPQFMAQLGATARFLAAQGVVHFDAHGGNIVTDGNQFFLTDFGLGLSRDFDLSDSERAFLERHLHYDQGMVACGLLFPVAGAVRRLSEPKRTQLEARFGNTRTTTLAPHLRQLVADGLLDLPDSLVELVEPRLGVIEEMVGFFDHLREAIHTTHFPDQLVAKQLATAPTSMA